MEHSIYACAGIIKTSNLIIALNFAVLERAKLGQIHRHVCRLTTTWNVHLGHILSQDLSDNEDIVAIKKKDMCRKANCMLSVRVLQL